MAKAKATTINNTVKWKHHENTSKQIAISNKQARLDNKPSIHFELNRRKLIASYELLQFSVTLHHLIFVSLNLMIFRFTPHTNRCTNIHPHTYVCTNKQTDNLHACTNISYEITRAEKQFPFRSNRKPTHKNNVTNKWHNEWPSLNK